MAASVPETADQLQDLEVPSKMPRPWTALRRGPNIKDDKYVDTLPPITAAQFKRQRRARAAAEAEQDQGQRKPMKVTRHHSLRHPGDDLDQQFNSPKIVRKNRPQSPASQAGRAIANMAQEQMTMHKALQNHTNATLKISRSNKSVRSQYESDSDFIGSSESSGTHDVATDAIDELCSNSARLTSEIMEMISKTSTDSIPSQTVHDQRPRSGLRRSLSLNDRTGSSRRKLTAQISVPADVHNTVEYPKAPRSTTSRPHSAWTEYSKASRPVSGRLANGTAKDDQSGNGSHLARDSKHYEHEYINNDNLEGWSDDDDSDWSSDGSCEGLDSGYDIDNDDIEPISSQTGIGGHESRVSQINEPKGSDEPKGNTETDANANADKDSPRKSRESRPTTSRLRNESNNTRPTTSRSRNESNNTPQQRSRSNPPTSRMNVSPSQSSIRVEDWLITCRGQKTKPLTCLPDIIVTNSPRL